MRLVDLNGTLDLEVVAERPTKTIYEPEQFPGLIYRMKEPKTVILIFSGKLVITRAKRESDVNLAVKKLRGTLEKKGLISYDELASRRDTIDAPTMVPVSQTQP